jgi:hypothetical protein
MDGISELTLEEMRRLGSFSATGSTVSIEWDKESLDKFFAMTYDLLGLTTGMMKGMTVLLERIKTLEFNQVDIHKSFASSKDSLDQVIEMIKRQNVANKKLTDAFVKIGDSLANHISNH